MSLALEGGIADLASRQHGVVTRAQLLDLGMTPRMVDRRVEAKRLRVLHRGVYRAGGFVSPREREMAAVLACGPGCVVAGRSAAGLLTIRPRPRDSDPVEVLIPHGDRGRREGIFARRAYLPTTDVTTVDGIPVTTVARTLLDREDQGRTIARAQKKGLITRQALDWAVRRYRGRPGAPLLRAVLQAGGPAFTRSEAEARFLELMKNAGLPRPEVNVRIAGYEVDFLWRSRRLIVEVDGYQYHSSKQQFKNDRRRNSRLAARGFHVIRLSWDQIVDEPIATVAEMVQTLMRAEGGSM